VFPVLVLLGALILVALFVMGQYNRLVKLRNMAEEAWAGIDVELRRRHDLIPNLLETVKGYAAHEEGVFTAVTEARSNAVSAGSVGESGKAEGALSGTLRSLFAVAEDYPDLKADANFRELQAELAATEDRLARSRQIYNGAVRAYDTAREVFPGNIIAGMFNFAPREYFEIDDPEAREPVRVEF
jgi:LemA protein